MIKKVFFILTYIFLTVSVFSQWNDTGTLTVRGNMPLITELRIIDNGVTLNLEQPQTDVVIASVIERSNSSSGYRVTLTSLNGGNLVSSDDEMEYSILYDGSDVDLSNPSIISENNNRTSLGGIEKELSVTHSGSSEELLLSDGDYSDSLTFEITIQ